MTILRPLLMQASGADATFAYSAQQHRALVGATLSEGVLTTADLLVEQRAAGANFTVDVSAGKAVIVGDSVAAQGSYLVINDAAVTGVVIPAAPASGTRIHRVVLQVRDRAHDGTVSAGVYDAVVLVLEDTGAGTPALPASAITLALVTVAAGTASITNSNISGTGRVLARAPSYNASRYGPGTPLAQNFGAGPVTVNSLSIPAAPYARIVTVNVGVMLSKTDGSDFDLSIARGTGSTTGLSVARSSVSGRVFLTPSYAYDLAADTADVLNIFSVRNSGAGTAVSFADSLINRIDVLAVPA